MLIHRRLDELTITDEASFRGIALYGRLKQALLDAGAEYLVMPEGPLAGWDNALLLNLTYWQPGQPDDVLEEERVPADVVAHRAWHHLAHGALGDAATTTAGLLFGEAIASAFDVYLVGRLLVSAPSAQMLESQVPAMADVAAQAGLDEAGVEALLAGIAAEPEVAFEQLRELLFDVGCALGAARNSDQAAQALHDHRGHPYAPLLHHYELSNWTLHGRAFGTQGDDEAVRRLDAELRQAPDALAWLSSHWLPNPP